MIWDDNAIIELRKRWATGESTTSIARNMGCSKNSIVGKAHRLDGLIGRPSPIRRPDGWQITSKQIPTPRVVGPTLPPLQSSSPSFIQARPSFLRPPPSPVPQPVATRAAIRPPPPPQAPPPVIYGRVQDCCWPIGDPGTKSFSFCSEPSAPGKVYCIGHCQKAFVRI